MPLQGLGPASLPRSGAAVAFPVPTSPAARRMPWRSATPGSVLPEALEPVCREFGIPHRVLNVPVPEIVLEGARVLPVVGEP